MLLSEIPDLNNKRTLGGGPFGGFTSLFLAIVAALEKYIIV